MVAKKKAILEMGIVLLLIVVIPICVPFILSSIESIYIKMIFMVLTYCLMVGIVIIACKFKKTPVFANLGFTKARVGKQILIAFALFAITTILFVAIPLIFGVSKADVLSFKAKSIGILVFYIVYDMIFVGFGEEIIFRGYFYEKLKSVTHSGILAVLISSILFGLWHYPVNRNPPQIIIATVIGVIYGLGRLKIKNCTTLSTAIAHGLHDTFILVLSYFLL